MSNSDWIDKGVSGKYTIHNSIVGMTVADVDSMRSMMMTPPITHLIFGDYQKWCSSLTFYPFNVNRDGIRKNLYVGLTEIENVGCYTLSDKHLFGYNMGEYFYKPDAFDYTDFEPYTTLQIYLPYYGFVDIPIAQVYRQYIQFRLYVDYFTGQAQYIIGVSDHHIVFNNPPYIQGNLDFNTRIIGTYVFQMGVNIPLGQTGMAETIRNMTMGAIKGAATIAASYVAGAAGANVVRHSGSTVQTSSGSFTRSSPKTGRMLKNRGTWDKEVVTETSSVTDYSGHQKANRINACFETFADTLNSAHLTPSTDKANNSFVNCYGCKSIKIIKKKARKIDDTSDYGHIYGYPLGETIKLGDISGYTEIDGVHIEGEDFSGITNDERAELENILTHGFILPENEAEKIHFTVDPYDYTSPKGFDWISWINFGYSDGFTYDDTYVYDKFGRIITYQTHIVNPKSLIVDGGFYKARYKYIYFKIDGLYYTTTYGTTWKQFVDSGIYEGFTYDNVYVYAPNGKAISLTSMREVSPNDTITDDYTYITAAITITFSIGGFEYSALRDMTFYEWCKDLNYNTGNFRCANTTDYVYAAESNDNVTTSDGEDVLGLTPIIEGASYLIKEHIETYTFTIDGNTRRCVAGMTWTEWCADGYYNIDEWETADDRKVYFGGEYIQYNGVAVMGNQPIINNAAYTIMGSITIAGTIYDAPKGSTWFTWANNLNYNTDNFRCLNVDSKVFAAESENYVIDSNGNAVYGEDLITIGGYYNIEQPPTTTPSFQLWKYNTELLGEFDFVEGMTWSEFINSTYNPSSSYYPNKLFYSANNDNSNSSIYYNHDGSGIFVRLEPYGDYIRASDLIINGYDYDIGGGGGGSN